MWVALQKLQAAAGPLYMPSFGQPCEISAHLPAFPRTGLAKYVLSHLSASGPIYLMTFKKKKLLFRKFLLMPKLDNMLQLEPWTFRQRENTLVRIIVFR